MGGCASLTRDKVDEWIENDKTSLDAFDGLEEGNEVPWEGEGTIFTSVERRLRLLDIGENLDAGEVGPQGSEKLELGGGGICVRCDDDDASLYGRSAIGHGGTGGDCGCDLKCEKGFSRIVIAVEERNACERETFLPEPANGAGTGSCEFFLVDGKGVSALVADRMARRSLRFAVRGVVGFQWFVECWTGRCIRRVKTGGVVGFGWMLGFDQVVGTGYC